MKRIVNFFKSVAEEMRKVTWPTAAENRRDSGVVISTTTIFAIFFAIIDWIIMKCISTFVVK